MDPYRSSSSSASSPAAALAMGRRHYYLPARPARPISFEDSPDWADDDVDSIHLATASASASLPTTAYPSPSPTPSSSSAACRGGERKVAGATLVWKELSVSLTRSRSGSGSADRRVVKSSTGYALPGTLTVIMGPARSGKSTLLRAIAGRLRPAERMYGQVLLNATNTRLPYGSYVCYICAPFFMLFQFHPYIFASYLISCFLLSLV